MDYIPLIGLVFTGFGILLAIGRGLLGYHNKINDRHTASEVRHAETAGRVTSLEGRTNALEHWREGLETYRGGPHAQG